MAVLWTPGQVLALAPDPGVVRSAQDLATPRQWQQLGANEQCAWGLHQGSGSAPYQVQIELSGPALHCTCPSRKQPCKHSVGLFLLLVSQPQAFSSPHLPEWVAEWLQKRQERLAAAPAAGRPRKSSSKAGKSSDPKKRSARRQSNVAAGVADLERWLHDLVRQGLAQLTHQQLRTWETTAARLVDAQAPGLARCVRELYEAALAGASGRSRLLEQASHLYLLVQAFQHIDSLPPGLQAEVRQQIGWTVSQDELQALPGVCDRWLVVGRHVQEETSGPAGRKASLVSQRTWLLGQQNGRSALVLQFAFAGEPLDQSLPPGSVLEAELVYYPGAYPLRASLRRRLSDLQPLQSFGGYASLREASAAYSAALAQNPWNEAFPLALQAVVPFQQEQNWAVRDEQNDWLPLSPAFAEGWELLAISGGQPLPLFGEWNGRTLQPMGTCIGGAWYGLGERNA